MLGITTPDAISFGMMVLAALAAWRGVTQGDSAKKQAISAAPGVAISGGIVDAMAFGDYIKVLDKLAIAMTRHAAVMERSNEVKTTNALEDLAKKIDDAMHERSRRSR